MRQLHRYVTVTGKGYRPRIMDLRKWRIPLCILTFTLGILLFILPVLIVVLSSFMPYVGEITLDTFKNLTVNNYYEVMDARMTRATINTLLLACFGGLIITLLTMLTAYVSYRTKIKGRKFAETISFFPVAYPSIFIGVALIWIFSYVRIGIYGTLQRVGDAFSGIYPSSQAYSVIHLVVCSHFEHQAVFPHRTALYHSERGPIGIGVGTSGKWHVE
jgi:iron(III) transport system permease protein